MRRVKMARKGLGKGLDSLIPEFYDEDFDSNSPQSLEDMLNETKGDEEEVKVEEEPVEEITEEVEEENDKGDSGIPDESGRENQGDQDTEKPQEDEVGDGEPENVSGTEGSEENIRTSQKVQIRQEHIDEVKQIVDKNPRITLWSSRSAAVFRYLRKTEPEFSISKEASVLIDEAVAKKYPEIWELFDDY